MLDLPKYDAGAAAQDSDLDEYGVLRVEEALGRHPLERGGRRLRDRVLAEDAKRAPAIFLELLDDPNVAIEGSNRPEANQNHRLNDEEVRR